MLTTIKVYACYAVKIYKIHLRCAGPESVFVKLEIIFFYFLFSMHGLWLAKGTFKIIISYTNLRHAFSRLSYTMNNKLLFNLICKLILQKWIINFINLRYLKTWKCSWILVRTYKMCAVDIQNLNVFVNRLYRKEIKDNY